MKTNQKENRNPDKNRNSRSGQQSATGRQSSQIGGEKPRTKMDKQKQDEQDNAISNQKGDGQRSSTSRRSNL